MDKKDSKLNYGLIMTVYLLGIFMGALDTGIVTPARTVIQDSLLVDEKLGIWMITIYTLAYAASIPVMGKLADRMGRRNIYLVSIGLFGAGSLMCGLSHYAGSFTLLLISRAIQAIGGGGIMPVATAEFGTTFPEEKRGMALGMVGGVYGIANIFGASAGSAIMDLFGADRWEFIFYVNVPISIFILIAGFICLPNTKAKETKPIDGFGTCILVVMILSLLYGLKNIDFFNFTETITDPEVFVFLIIFFVLLPVFILVERKAQDPIMNLKYFTNSRILMTLCVTVVSGIIMMGMIFIPQFCENALKLPSGDGGYFVIILGVCAGIGSMSSGKMTDKMGPKLVLMLGLLATILGAMIVIFLSSQNPNRVNVFASLIFIGLGIGFTMGAPLNYMMLSEVHDSESASALATLSLVRSLGTVVAPAIMIGFISHAGAGISDNIMEILPKEVEMPQISYESIMSDMSGMEGIEGMPDMSSMTEGVEGMPDMSSMTEGAEGMPDMSGMTGADAMAGMEAIAGMPDLSSMDSINLDDMMGSGNPDMELPDEILAELQASDVTTIVECVKHMAAYFFESMSVEVIDKVVEKAGTMGDAIKEVMQDAFDEAEENYLQAIDDMSEEIEKVYQDSLNVGFRQIYLMTAIGAAVGFLILLLYPKKKKGQE